MWPFPVAPGVISVQRTIQLASGPPILGDAARLAKLLRRIVATSVLLGPLANDAPSRSRLSPVGVRVPLAERSASPAGSMTEPITREGPLPTPTLPTDANRLGPLIWRLMTSGPASSPAFVLPDVSNT